MRRLALLALLFPSVVFGQIPEKRITFLRDAGRAKAVLAELGDEAGIKLETSPQTQDEVIVVAVRDAPLKETLDRIASAVNGAWKTEKDVYRLIRTPQQTRQEEREAWEREMNRIRAALDRRRKSAHGEFTESEAQKLAAELREWVKAMKESTDPYTTFNRIYALDSRGPLGRAVTRIVESLDPADLAGLETGERIVYSNKPTRMQRPLPNVADVNAALFQDQKTWAEVLQTNPVEQLTRGGTPWHMGSLGSEQRVFPTTPHKIVCSVRRGLSGDFYIQLMAGDVSGNLLGFAAQYLDAGTGDPEVDARPKPAGDSPVLQIPDDLRRLADAINARVLHHEPLPSEVFARIARPDRSDPLSLFVSPLLRLAAQSRNANLVACLPDLYPLLTPRPNEKPKRDEFVRRLEMQGLRIDREDGWWVGRPREPQRVRRERADRDVLTAVMRNVLANGRVTLDDRARIASRFSESMVNRLPMTWIRLALKPGQDTDASSELLLKFYGALDAGERTRLRKGMAYASLNPKAREELARFVYHAEPYLTIDPTRDPGGRVRTLVSSGLGRDTTESLPEGIPADTRITITETESDVLFVPGGIQGTLRYPPRSLSVDEFAMVVFSSNNRSLFPYRDWETEPPVPGQFRMGKRKRVTLAFEFTPVLGFTDHLQENAPPSDRLITYDDLSPEFKRQVSERLEVIRRRYARPPTSPSVSGGAPIPPP